MKHQRYVLLSFVVGAILTGWAVQAACVSGFARFAVPDSRVLGLLNTSSVLAVAAAAATFVGLLRSLQATSFTDGVIGARVRVTWPTKDETVKASTTVVLTTVFTAGLLAVYDLIWKNLADLILFTPQG